MGEQKGGPKNQPDDHRHFGGEYKRKRRLGTISQDPQINGANPDIEGENSCFGGPPSHRLWVIIFFGSQEELGEHE